VFDSSTVPSAIVGSAEQYRLKARNYRASASAERDWNRREAFELLADTFDRLAADYERAESSSDVSWRYARHPSGREA
jgi:hypothetical protein